MASDILTAPSLYLNQCWLTINTIFWHSYIYIYQFINPEVAFEIYTFEISATSLSGQWVKVCNIPIVHTLWRLAVVTCRPIFFGIILLPQCQWSNPGEYMYTETKMSSFWRNFNHWLHWKLSFWQLPVQPVMKISSKWRHFRFSVWWLNRMVTKGVLKQDNIDDGRFTIPDRVTHSFVNIYSHHLFR